MEEDFIVRKRLSWQRNGHALLAAHRTYWQNGSIAAEAKAYIREHFLVDISGYDVIIGYRADDSYFAFAQDFAAGGNLPAKTFRSNASW